MRSKLFLMLWVMAILSVGPFCGAESVQISPLGSLIVEETPLDISVSANGQWVYVLSENRNLFVFTVDGRLQGKFPVDPGTDRISTGPREDVLFLVNRAGKTVQAIQVSPVREIPTKGSALRGPADAPVEIVVFSDFQCPTCGKIAENLSEVMQKNPSKARLVFKHYPLRSHEYAFQAACAAMAALRQEKFWEFHDGLFKNSEQLNAEKIREIARKLGLDMVRFEKDLLDPGIAEAVKKDAADGIQAGVRGTPTIFINGVQAMNLSLSWLEALVDKEWVKAKSAKEAAQKKQP